MEFRMAIVDECGTIKYFVSELAEDEAEEILDNHPEWTLRCVEA